MNMTIINKCLLVLILISCANSSYSQTDLNIVNIGDFATTNGDVIKDCRIGYRTFGTLNADKSNVVICPTWFMGTSSGVIGSDILTNTLDTANLFFIVVDALGNGISSSPTDITDFPELSIRDMVNSQHELLTKHLNINHAYMFYGVSMGGMQVFEWMVAYPEFMDKVISIVPTPKASFYDKLVWQSEVTLIKDAGNDKEELEYAMKRVKEIDLLTTYTPAYLNKENTADDFDEIMNKEYSNYVDPMIWMSHARAIATHDIYKNEGVDLENIDDVVKAEVLIIVSQQDHLVNPMSSVELAEALKSDLHELTGNCGHIAVFCEIEKVEEVVSDFLNK